MKKIILLLIVCLSSFSSIAQHTTPTTFDAVMDSIYAKAERRNFDLKPLVDKYVGEILIVDSLESSPYNTQTYGKVERIGNTHQGRIFIIKEMFEDFYMAERVMIHEIGHALGLKHCCKDAYCAYIMAPQQVNQPEHIIYQIAFQTEEYERAFDVFFYYLDRRWYHKDLEIIPPCRVAERKNRE